MERAELRAEVARKGVSNRAISQALGISEQAFYNKMSGKAEFKESEIKKIAQVLLLTSDDVNRIFFAQ